MAVKYNYLTNKWEAVLGKKVLGIFKTKDLAQKAYNKRAQELFTFPLLEKVKEDEQPPDEDPTSDS